VLLLIAVWLIVLGYTLSYVGFNTLNGKQVSFLDALTGKSSG
jgi:hypothetical protein